MDGFFSTSRLSAVKQPPSLVPRCGVCGLYKTCKSPKMSVSGKGERGILIIGEAPGRTEDEKNQPFVGKSGQILRATLNRLGVDLERDCWVTNSLICRPPSNETPTKRQIEFCRPNVLKVIGEYKPKVIVLLGQPAIASVIGYLWRENPGSMTRWAGWGIPCQRWNTWICPTYHPAYLMYSQDGDPKYPAIKLLFEKHLRLALRHTHRPWREVPDYKSQIQLIYDPNEAKRVIESHAGEPFSFDLETNLLKPDTDGARIVCCSICWNGVETIAFPWEGSVIPTMREWLDSRIPKIGYNCEFETRWIQKILGIRVRNWYWDGMLAAHALDSRKDIVGLKFQAFALLGAESYDEHIKGYLRSEGTNTFNKIDRIELRDLLMYCALDSSLEYQVALRQMKMLGVRSP